jgi:hypothetical protein
MSNILSNMNIIDSKHHIQNNYKTAILKYGWRNELNNNSVLSFVDPSKIIKEIKEDSFLTGHIWCTQQYKDYLKDFKKIVLIRNIDEIIYSAKTFNKEKNKNMLIAESHINKILEIEDWKYEPDSFLINFNILVTKDYELIDKLQIFLFSKIMYNSKNILDKSLMQKTNTKSNNRVKSDIIYLEEMQ